MEKNVILEINQIKKMMGLSLIMEATPITALRDVLVTIGKNLDDVALTAIITKNAKKTIKKITFDGIAELIEKSLVNTLDDEGRQILKSYLKTTTGESLMSKLKVELEKMVQSQDPNLQNFLTRYRQLKYIRDGASYPNVGKIVVKPGDKTPFRGLTDVIKEKWSQQFEEVARLSKIQKFLLDKNGVIGSVGRAFYVFVEGSTQYVLNIPGLKNMQVFTKLREESIVNTINKLKSLLENPDPNANFSELCKVELDILKTKLDAINQEEVSNYLKMVDFLELEAQKSGQGLRGNEKKQYTEACNQLFKYLKDTETKAPVPIVGPIYNKLKSSFIGNMVTLPKKANEDINWVEWWKNFLKRVGMTIITGIPKKMSEWSKGSEHTNKVRFYVEILATLYFIHFIVEPIINGIFYIFKGLYEIGIMQTFKGEGMFASFGKGILQAYSEWLETEDREKFQKEMWQTNNGELLDKLLSSNWDMKKVLTPLSGWLFSLMNLLDSGNREGIVDPNLVHRVDSVYVDYRNMQDSLRNEVIKRQKQIDSLLQAGQPVKIDSIPSVNVQDTTTNANLDF